MADSASQNAGALRSQQPGAAADEAGLSAQAGQPVRQGKKSVAEYLAQQRVQTLQLKDPQEAGQRQHCSRQRRSSAAHSSSHN